MNRISPFLHGLAQRLRETLSRRGVDAELDDEMRFHIERETERLIGEGRAPDDARAEAARRFGDLRRAREQAREEYGFRWIEQSVRDLRHAARGLRRHPTFAGAVVLTLGLAIGATTVAYSVVDSVLLEPLPYPDSDRLVRFYEQNSPTNRWNVSVADFKAVIEYNESFEAVAALQIGEATLTGRGPPERVPAARVTAGWFDVLGIAPAEGRGFLAGEDEPGTPRVVVVSAAFRDRVWGRGADALGDAITLDGVPHTVIGVLPYDRPALAGHDAQLWSAIHLAAPTRRGPFFLRGYGRLEPGVSLESARADLARISQRIYPLWAEGFRDAEARITPYSLQEVMVGGVRRGVWLLFAAVGGILLIAVANVVNLFLVRASGRGHEMALRTSLGASRARLTRQLLAESLFLAAIGGTLGIALARLGLDTLVATSPSLPRLEEVSLDRSVLSFTAAITLVCGTLFGLTPLLQSFSSDLMSPLRLRDRGRAAGSAWGRLRAGLVTAEFAVALPLLAGAGLLLGSFLRLQRVDPGYDPDNLISGRVSLPAATYPGYAEIVGFWDEALRRIEEIPGVVAAGIGTGLPPDLRGNTNNFDLLDNPVPSGDSEHSVSWIWASPGYFEALGVAPRRGRALHDADGRDSMPVVVVSEAWGARYYPGEDPLGKRLYAGGDRSNPMTVIGVLGDVKYTGLAGTDDVVVYEPFTQAGFRDVRLLVRSARSSAGVPTVIRSELQALDPDLPLSEVQTMSARLAEAVSGPRYWTVVLGVFAGLGMLLAAIGVYGVLSFYVTRQRREIGIRMALGARPGAVRRIVFLRGMSRAGLGLGVGVAMSLLLGRALERLLFDVSPADPVTLVVVALVLGIVAALGCLGPALRATRTDPVESLRAD